MYSTQDTSAIWQDDYTSLLEQNGFKRGRASTAAIRNAAEDFRILVHGDDLRLEGCVGMKDRDSPEMCVLNRMTRYKKENGVVEYEADQRHAELIIEALGLEKTKAVTTPAEKKTAIAVSAALSLPKVDDDRKRFYWSLVMRASYLAQDRADVCECVVSLARKMIGPIS